jgi:hypothetical protein
MASWSFCGSTIAVTSTVPIDASTTGKPQLARDEGHAASPELQPATTGSLADGAGGPMMPAPTTSTSTRGGMDHWTRVRMPQRHNLVRRPRSATQYRSGFLPQKETGGEGVVWVQQISSQPGEPCPAPHRGYDGVEPAYFCGADQAPGEGRTEDRGVHVVFP